MHEKNSPAPPKPGSYYVNARMEMLRYIPADVQRVLEVGCAEGHFGSALKASRGLEVWGIETEAGPAAVARDQLDKLLLGSVEKDELDLPPAYFDCIIFNDVLEHLTDPWRVLQQLSRHLRPGGYVVASIPNVRYFPVIKKLLFKKEWRYVGKGVLDKTHLRFFTQSSIVEMFEECGFQVLQIEGINKMRSRLDFALLNGLFLNSLSDMRFMQFACVCRK